MYCKFDDVVIVEVNLQKFSSEVRVGCLGFFRDAFQEDTTFWGTEAHVKSAVGERQTVAFEQLPVFDFFLAAFVAGVRKLARMFALARRHAFVTLRAHDFGVLTFSGEVFVKAFDEEFDFCIDRAFNKDNLCVGHIHVSGRLMG